MSISTKSPRQFTPSAAILAWLWPGSGHIYLGERKRGLLVMFGVLFLFLGGILIGGLDVVDRRDDRLWFLAQILCGPVAIAADYANQRIVKPNPMPRPEVLVDLYEQGDPEIVRYVGRKSLGHVNEMGTLYCALAGLMNLVVILDALQPQPRRSEAGRRGAAP
ncbi:MAG: DUF6677 family protein [Planctomycetota bacterium]|jgi:hypothetical protein